jgi:hypothetical protein
MVWALGFNDGIGVTHSLMEMDGNLDKIEYVNGSADWGTVAGGFEPGDLNLGRALKAEHVPTKFLWGGPKNRKLPDVLYGRGVVIVSVRVKDIMERFEPGVHQYFPVNVIYKSSKEVAEKMFFLNICTRLDSVDRKLTTATLSQGGMWKPETGYWVFDLRKIGSHHFWHDQHLFLGWMISDSLKQAFEDASIKGFVYHLDKDNGSINHGA